MANLYLIESLAEIVIQRITDLKMTMDILLPSLAMVLEYRKLEGFNSSCDYVAKKIVETFSKQRVGNQHKF